MVVVLVISVEAPVCLFTKGGGPGDEHIVERGKWEWNERRGNGGRKNRG